MSSREFVALCLASVWLNSKTRRIGTKAKFYLTLIAPLPSLSFSPGNPNSPHFRRFFTVSRVEYAAMLRKYGEQRFGSLAALASAPPPRAPRPPLLIHDALPRIDKEHTPAKVCRAHVGEEFDSAYREDGSVGRHHGTATAACSIPAWRVYSSGRTNFHNVHDRRIVWNCLLSSLQIQRHQRRRSSWSDHPRRKHP